MILFGRDSGIKNEGQDRVKDAYPVRDTLDFFQFLCLHFLICKSRMETAPNLIGGIERIK